MQARHTDISVSFDGVDISDTVNKYLLSLSFTDNEEDEADDLQIKLEDRDSDWLQKWLNDTIQKAAEKGDGSDTVVVNDNRATVRQTVYKGHGSYDSVICHIYLEALGYYTGAIQPKPNDAMVKAIKAYQKANKLSVTGKCDTRMWKALTKEINGKTIKKYTLTYKASKTMAIRADSNAGSKKIGTLSKGETCIVLDHPKGGWFEIDYNGQVGYTNGTMGFVSAEKPAATPDGKTKGLGIRATITRVETDGTTSSLDCGRFELDSIKAQGPPATVTIKAVSLSYNGIRKTERDKSWEKYTLKKIAEEIAARAGLGVLFECDVDPKYDRIEQAQQTDISLLKKLCQDQGYSLKITDNQIVIFDQAKYEQLEDVAKISFGDGSYTKWNVGTGNGEVEYATCKVKYTDPKTGKVIKGEAHSEDYDPDDEKNETLVITDQKVSSVGEATELAEKQLKLHNKLEREATITLPGNPLLMAGMTVTLGEFGYWNGKYLIKKAKHDVSRNGYTTAITLRKVADAKPKQEEKQMHKVGDTVRFLGGNHFARANAESPSARGRTAGKAKVLKVKEDAKHPYKLQGGAYNSLGGKCNVNGWVNEKKVE